jgi:nicotinamidase-related amidase
LLLPFSDKLPIFLKNALTPAWAYREKRHESPVKTHPVYPMGYNPVFKESFERYLDTQDIRTAIIVGNCTDLCVRELAMHLKMWANEHQKDMRVVIPENCVQTFDLPFDVAEQIGAMPHPGDVYHVWALYEMRRNGIEVVREIV